MHLSGQLPGKKQMYMEETQMKKIYSTAILGTLLGALAFSALPAFAQDVTIVGAPIRIHVTGSMDGQVQTTETPEGEPV